MACWSTPSYFLNSFRHKLYCTYRITTEFNSLFHVCWWKIERNCFFSLSFFCILKHVGTVTSGLNMVGVIFGCIQPLGRCSDGSHGPVALWGLPGEKASGQRASRRVHGARMEGLLQRETVYFQKATESRFQRTQEGRICFDTILGTDCLPVSRKQT